MKIILFFAVINTIAIPTLIIKRQVHIINILFYSPWVLYCLTSLKIGQVCDDNDDKTSVRLIELCMAREYSAVCAWNAVRGWRPQPVTDPFRRSRNHVHFLLLIARSIDAGSSNRVWCNKSVGKPGEFSARHVSAGAVFSSPYTRVSGSVESLDMEWVSKWMREREREREWECVWERKGRTR